MWPPRISYSKEGLLSLQFRKVCKVEGVFLAVENSPGFQALIEVENSPEGQLFIMIFKSEKNYYNYAK